jgi:hypothetical protein
MAAAAFTATLIFKGANGKQLYVRATITDVAAAYWIYPDGSNILQLPASTTWYLVDVVVVTGGTDTTNSELYVNQMNSGIVIDHKSNLNTVQNRIFQANPLGFAAGSQLKLIQRA